MKWTKVLSVSCLYLACILPSFFCSVLYFSVRSCHRSVNAGCAFASLQHHQRIAAASSTHRGRIVVAFRSHRRRITVAESHRGRSASFAKCRRLEDFIGISSHSFSSGLWAKRRLRHFKACRRRGRIHVTRCTGKIKQLYTRSIEFKLCIARSIQ